MNLTAAAHRSSGCDSMNSKGLSSANFIVFDSFGSRPGSIGASLGLDSE